MTKINRLVMEGFKSFGKRTEMLFGDKFNVVLGPNGSGKSNVLDGICFVLGKSSSKQMRAEKSANLIYNGGRTKQPARQAEVSIFFDNNKRIFPTDEAEVRITRIVRADGQSRYKINNKTRTRQEILDLLSIARINPDGYNIILQGDIVSFVEMSDLERRELIEEAAEISVYEEKKRQALNDLAKVEEKLNQAEIILKERQTYLKELKKDRDQAAKYRDLSNQIKQNKASYLKRQIDSRDGELNRLNAKLNSVRESFEAFQARVKELRERINNKREEIKRISREAEQKGEIDQQLLQKGIEQLRVSLATNRATVSSHKNELARIAQRKEQLVQNLKELEKKIGELECQKLELGEKRNADRQQLAEIEAKARAFRKKYQLEDAENSERAIEQIDKDAEEKQHIIQEIKEHYQSALREKDRAEFQVQAVDCQIEKVLVLEKEYESEINTLKQKKGEFTQLISELNTLLDADSSLSVGLSAARTQLLRQAEELARLEVKNAAVREAQSSNFAVRKLLQNKDRLGGIYGTIAELGAVDPNYTTALEAAARNRIHSVIVKDDAVAAECIKHLRSSRSGIASFLPLNKIKPAQLSAEEKKLKSQKGVHGFAIELVSFEPMFKDAFSNVFGNTLVVDDIDSARRIGIGKARMVTLEGDLAETSGAMSGGFRQKKEGLFAGKEVAQAIERSQEEILTLKKKVSGIEKEKESIDKKLTMLRERKAELEGGIIRAEKSLHLDSTDLDVNKAYREELGKQLEAINKKIEGLLPVISKRTTELAGIKAKKQSIRDRIMQFRKPMIIAELNAFEETKRQLNAEMLESDAKIRAIETQIVNILERDRENSVKILKGLEKEEQQFNCEIESLERGIQETAAGLKEKELEQARFSSEFKALFEKRNKISDDVAEHENELFILEESGRKEEIEMNTLSIGAAGIKAELAGLNADFAQYDGIELNAEKSEEQLKKELAEFERMKEKIGSVNLRALEVYETVEAEYQALLEKKNTLIREKNDVGILIDEVEKKKVHVFMDTLDFIQKNFKAIFSALTAKGDAELLLENPERPFDGGLMVKVRLSGERFIDLRSLSGGEKTLTALAFIFAIQEREPASFYILDEVDAALDKHNSEKLAKLIRQYCGRAQYLIISHNDAMVSESDILYGVSMDENNMSRVIGLKV